MTTAAPIPSSNGHAHEPPAGEEHAVVVEGETTVERIVATNNDEDQEEENQKQMILSHYVKQSPGWRTKRRRQRSVEACATDLLQRLQTAADELWNALNTTAQPTNSRTTPPQTHRGVTLPVTALAWILLTWESVAVSAEHEGGAAVPIHLMDPFRRPSYRRKWRTLRHHLCTHVQHIKLVREPWPPRGQSREKRPSEALEFTDSDQAWRWLRAYYAWQTTPVADLRCMGEQLVFVWVHSVPSEYIILHPNLRVLRIQQSGIPSLSSLLRHHNRTTHRTDPTERLVFQHLTHLKITHCNLLSLAVQHTGENGTTVTTILPETCPQLQTLNLSHNALTDDAITHAGLDQLVNLQHVNLSYNYLRGMWQRGATCNNWTTLILAHNEISTIGRSLVQLYGVTTLDLSHNHLRYMSRVVRLVHLPLLQDLRLQGNPVMTRLPHKNRDLLWDLFRQARNGSTDLPTIDGQQYPISTSRTMNETNRPCTVENCLCIPSPSPVVWSTLRMNEIRWEGTATTRTDSRPKLCKDPLLEHPAMLVKEESAVEILPDFDEWKLLESLSPVGLEIEEDVLDKKDEVVELADDEEVDEMLPTVSASQDTLVKDVVLTESHECSEKDKISTETGDPELADMEGDNVEMREINENEEKAIASAECSTTEPISPSIDLRNGNDQLATEVATDTAQSFLETKIDAQQDTVQPHKVENIPLETSDMTATLTGSGNTGAVEKTEGEPVDIHEAASTKPERLLTPARSVPSKESSSSFSTATPETREGPYARKFKPPSPGQTMDASPSSLASPLRASFHVSFPDHVWQDETNSLCTMSYPDTAASGYEEVRLHEMAETKSTFVGPQTYHGLVIRENLELYFRLFVFSQAISSVPTFLDSSMDGDWQSILELYPRIQLWPIDRRLRDATTPDSPAGDNPYREIFRRVWTENVVACGKPALRRLTPNLTARLGFHGELMWSTNAVHLRQEAVSTHRLVILCFSSSAFYVILDHDAVTEKARTQKRRFPLPLPMQACFAEAKWPHALARHPFSMLRKVIIGFGFQRLTLRFSNSSYPSPEDFTYTLMTCNKLATVSILKDIQEIVSDTKQAAGFDQLTIENDDLLVLDALGKAIVPDVIGDVYHYQILEQRWKHGDRPNVRRVLLVTGTNIYLLDEDYLGDGAKKDTMTNVDPNDLGHPLYRLVDSATIGQIQQLHTGTDPAMITIVIRPPSRLSRIRNWRLVCRDREGKEKLVEDIRKAIGSTA